MMKRVAYIIPGYGESYLKQSGYKKIAKFFESQGITPIQVRISWRKKNGEDFKTYIDRFLKIYKKERGDEVYLLGFSFGAIIALIASIKIKPKTLILCSLSPYFKEDLEDLKPEWARWWKRNFKKEYSFNKIVPKIKTQTYLVVGSKESSFCIKRVEDAKKRLKGSHLKIAKGAKHNVSQKPYLSTVEKIVRTL